jgi:hypothetical protein
VQYGKNKFCNVKWVQGFGDDTVGSMHLASNEILIKLGMSDKLTITTYIHELLHLFSDANEVGLTENQILKLEKCFYYALKENNLFTDKK